MTLYKSMPSSRFLFRCAFLLAWVSASLAAEPAPGREFVPLFAPLRTPDVVLAPDGRHVAYALHAGGSTALLVVNVDHPTEKTMVAKCNDARTEPGDAEDSPVPLRFLDWATANRLVYSFAPATGLPQQFFAVDADGKNTMKIIEQGDLDYFASEADESAPAGGSSGSSSTARTPRPLRVLGFLPDHPDELVIEAIGELIPRTTNVPTALFAIGVESGRLRPLGEGMVDAVLQYDQQGSPRIAIGAPTADSRETISLSENPHGWDQWIDLNRYLGAGENRFTLSASNVFDRRAFPVGFDYDPNILYFASNIDRDTYGIYAFDLKKKQRTALAIEDVTVDLADAAAAPESSPLIFDRERHTLVGVQIAAPDRRVKWIDSDLREAQSTLEEKFPHRLVRIGGWSTARDRFLFSVATPFDPGRTFVYDRPHDLAIEFFRRAETHASVIARTLAFTVDLPSGEKMEVWLALPAQNKINPPPLVVYCPDQLTPWEPLAPQPDLEALAKLGAMVARVEYRAASGVGQKNLASFRAAFDRASADDLVAAMAWIAAHYPYNSRRVAIVGQGFGGFVALRALQLHPDAFRCGIMIDALTDLNAWLSTDAKVAEQNALNFGAQAVTQQAAEIAGETARAEDRPRGSPSAPGPLRHGGPDFIAAGLGGGRVIATEQNALHTGPTERLSYPQRFADNARRAFFGVTPKELAERSPFAHPELVAKPILFLQNRDDPATAVARAQAFSAMLKKLGRESMYVEVDGQFARRLPYASARAFAKIDEFFNLHLYNFRVDLGETKEAP